MSSSFVAFSYSDYILAGGRHNSAYTNPHKPADVDDMHGLGHRYFYSQMVRLKYSTEARNDADE